MGIQAHHPRDGRGRVLSRMFPPGTAQLGIEDEAVEDQGDEDSAHFESGGGAKVLSGLQVCGDDAKDEGSVAPVAE